MEEKNKTLSMKKKSLISNSTQLSSHSSQDLKCDRISENIKIGLLRYMTLMRSLAWRHSENYNITPLQGEILCVLQVRSVMRLKEIAHETGLTAATTSDAVSTLCYKGLCEKSRDLDDARALAVRLTPKGADLALKTNKNCWVALTDSIQQLKIEEQVSMYRSMLKMLAKFEEKELIGKHRSCINCRHFKSSEIEQEFDKTVILRRGSGLNSSMNFCSKYNAEFTDAHIRLDCSDFLEAELSKINSEKKMFFRRI